MNTIKVLKTDSDHEQALQELMRLMDLTLKRGVVRLMH